MKPSLNDIGIEGRKPYNFDADKCRGCEKCQVEAGCPSKAVYAANGKMSIKKEACLSCGVCIGKCPFGAVPAQASSLCVIYVGGTWGKSQRMGTPLSKMLPVEEVADVVERIIGWYRRNGKPKERLGHTIDRLGMKALEEEVLQGL